MLKRCFVIMPFSETTNKHTSTYWDNFFNNFLKPSVEEFGYSCFRSKAQPSSIIKDILKELYNVDLVIATLTDYNANVWYELGIRHALRKGTIMIIEKGQKIPFDISNYGAIIYEDTISGTSDFKKQLKSFIERIEKEHPTDNPVIDFLETYKKKDDTQWQEDIEMKYNKRFDQMFELVLKLQQDKISVIKQLEKPRKLTKNKVLWVDDSPKNNEAIMDLYMRQNIEFNLALSTDQAILYLNKNEYNLIISDIGRGRESDAGIRMIREITRSFSKLPPILIFTSGYSVKKYEKEAKKEGAAFITSDTGDLMEKINQFLNLI